ncbi:hypothetical protein GGF46_000120 [Coemansia sp. RSA 552]|nr:hypothetical protein GGF46_000120 [Coemansia sp. RSA 552]
MGDLVKLLETVDIGSTEELTRTLRSAAHALPQRLALAWAVFAGTADHPGIQKLGEVLVRRDEFLADWLFSTILRELKPAPKGKPGAKSNKPSAKNQPATDYVMAQDPLAIRLLRRLLESIKQSYGKGLAFDMGIVLPGPPMPLFMTAFTGDTPPTTDTEYIAEIAGLWRFIAEETSDGQELLAGQPDQLVHIISTLATMYLDNESAEIQTALRGMLSLAVVTMRNSCESSLNPRKVFQLFDSSALPVLLRLVSALGDFPVARNQVLDMLQAGLFHVENMSRFITALAEKKDAAAEGEHNYVSSFFTVVSAALADGLHRTQCAKALSGLLDRYLQAAALVCPETHGMAQNTIGLSAIAANPFTVSQVEASSSCLGMFVFLYGLVGPHCSDLQVLAATNQLVRVYFSNPCFGTVNNANVLNTDVYQRQSEALSAWLTTAIGPILIAGAGKATSEAFLLALDGVGLALDAGAELVQTEQVLKAMVHVPTEAAAAVASTVLIHLVSTLRKARKLDTLLCGISCIRASQVSPEYTNLLASPAFLSEMARAVSQSMPFAQVGSCLTALVEGLLTVSAETSASSEHADDEGRTKKRRRVSAQGGSVEMLTMVLANFVLASVSTVGTEHQRVGFTKQLTASYEQLIRALEGACWERLLLHYTYMEAAGRLDGTERWLETCLYPERVRKQILPKKSDDPRVSTIGMLVAFQAAAHWSAFESSHSAGIIPESVVAKVDFAAGAKATGKMTASLFPSNCLKLDDSSNGRGLWDGQAYSIDASNYQTAQWRLLVEWLELACEYAADASVVSGITKRLIHGMISQDGDSHERALLRSASFFEIPAIRKAFVPALLELASQLWASQMEQLRGDDVKAPKAARKIDGMLRGLNQAHTNSNSSESAKQLSDIVADGMKLLDTKSKRQLSSESAGVWIRLLQCILQCPLVYWGGSTHTIAVFALVVDLGVSRAVVDDRTLLRVLSSTLLERLLAAHPEMVAADFFLPNLPEIVGRHWSVAEADLELAQCTRDLESLTMNLLAQASFGQSQKPADSICRKLCTQIYERMDTHAADSLDSLRIVSSVAHQYTARANKQHGAKKWTKLLQPWIHDTEKALVRGLETGVGGEQGVRLVGLYAALARLLGSLRGNEGVDGASSVAARVVEMAEEQKKTRQLADESFFALVVFAVQQQTETGTADARKLLGILARYLTIAGSGTDDSMSPLLQAAIAAIANVRRDAIPARSDAAVVCGIEPLLKMLDEPTFVLALATFQKIATSSSSSSVAGKVILAFVRASSRGAWQQRAVQRQLGSILTALHTSVRANFGVGVATSALGIVSEALGLRCSMFEAAECLAIVSSIVSHPIPAASFAELEDLYCLACRCLGSIARHHTNVTLGSVSLLVGILRSMLHAFIAPASSAAIDRLATPWIVAYAPFTPRCAEAYSRALNDLCRARKTDSAGTTRRFEAADTGDSYVRLTRGTSAASTASVLTTYAPHLLAEYCVIQSGGGYKTALSAYASGNRGSLTGDIGFCGISWRPMPVALPLAGSGSGRVTSGSSRSIITDPTVRDALLGGWYALLDVVEADDRTTLLALLAAGPAPKQARPSIFGPDRHDGANEVLKSLYQSYVDFYKYTGNV